MKLSVGIIPYKIIDGKIQFFLGHPGGGNDNRWYFLKGGVEKDEEYEETAIREFKEESGIDFSMLKDKLEYVGQVQQNPKKIVMAYSLMVDDINPSKCKSNLIEDGVTPEIDDYRWMTLDEVLLYAHKKHIELYKTIAERYENHQ